MIENRAFDSMLELNKWVKSNIRIIKRIINIQYIENDKKHLMYFITY